MQRKLILTADGSHTLEIPGSKITYHSIHGAVQESKHIFIETGFNSSARLHLPGGLSIFEVGFGTGLNALLTLIEAERMKRRIYYETVELFPLCIEEVKSLNYCRQLQRNDLQTTFEQFHICDWEKDSQIAENFIFKKSRADLLTFEVSSTSRDFDLVYFDPFDPGAQPGLWTEEIFKKMWAILKPGGMLVTYSSKGNVRRSMQTAGFMVKKIPGPKGKREITRATKMPSPPAG